MRYKITPTRKVHKGKDSESLQIRNVTLIMKKKRRKNVALKPHTLSDEDNETFFTIIIYYRIKLHHSIAVAYEATKDSENYATSIVKVISL